MNKLDIPTNSIIITKASKKQELLKQISKKNLTNTKIITLSELRKKLYFTYDDEALYYLMDKYNYQYDVAKMYLSRLYEVKDNSFGNEKIKKIIALKQELTDNNLLYYSPSFREYLKDKTLILYHCDDLNNLDEFLLEEISTITTTKSIATKLNNYNHKVIYEFDTIEDEVIYIANKICELIIEKNIPINNIKLCNAKGEYSSIIKRIFKLYHIPITFEDNYLYSTKIAGDFLSILDNNIVDAIKHIEEKYSLKNDKNLEIINKIINIVNRYAWAENISKLKPLLIEQFKTTTINNEHYEQEVEIINDIEDTNDKDYIFLLGFNQGDIPKTYKDESYFNDSIKCLLGLETIDELNKKTYNKWLKNIKNTKNLIITTKLTSSLGEHYLSSLNDDLNLDIIKPKKQYKYSNLHNQLLLAQKLDTLVKYGEKEEDLELLYSNYSSIPYGIYNSDYHKIDKTKLKEYLQNKLTLSYSAMNTYYQCGFRYYLSNVLKLNVFEETFYTILGNLFHYILSISLEKDINLNDAYYNYISKIEYQFNSREKFFLDELLEDLEFIIKTIKKQKELSTLTKTHYEEKIEVDKSRDDLNITFKGFIDKMVTNEQGDIISIIDYKTGSPDLNLNHIIYGLDLQLPVYIYLARKKFPNSKIAGFYLQKILNSKFNKDNKHTYESLKEEKLKLQGYSNFDISILEKFDSSYNESKMIKGMRTTSKGIASKKILNNEQIDELENITENKINEAIDNIIDANFDINPKRIGMDNLGCKYCNFKDICFFKEKDIVNLKEYKNMEFLGGDEYDTN